MTETHPWPTELRLNKDKTELRVMFDNGEAFSLLAELLRVESPSAEVQGHSAAERKTVAGKRYVMITQLEPVGHYAVRIIFSDGHSTGIFSWSYLFELGRDAQERWNSYLSDLAGKGLSRG